MYVIYPYVVYIHTVCTLFKVCHTCGCVHRRRKGWKAYKLKTIVV